MKQIEQIQQPSTEDLPPVPDALGSATPFAPSSVETSDRDRLGYLREKAAVLPRSPGVYLMQNAGGHVIYVGKSRSLRDRVSQYFHGSHDPKTTKMASSVYDFRFVTCNTEMEALALENSLIKQYTPKYNIKLKDSKSYPYIKITVREQYPRIVMTRKRLTDGNLYFGPYSSTQTVYSVISSLERTLGIPTCRKQFPEAIGKERPCVFAQIGRCVGLCTGKISQTEYREIMDRAAAILRGGTQEVIASLTEQMNRAAEALEFETAARCRDSIAALRKLGEKQKAVGAPDVECDVIGLHLTSFESDDIKFRDCASIFYIRSGYISDTEHFLFGAEEILPSKKQAEQAEQTSNGDESAPDEGAPDESAPDESVPDEGVPDEGVPEESVPEEDSPLSAFLTALYQTREYIPREILLSFELPDHEIDLLTEYLANLAGHAVTIRTPKRGAGRYLCEMAVEDAKTHAENTRKQETGMEKTLVNLASLLKLEVFPARIEAYDISNLGSEHITAGMITLIDGKYKKDWYRTFKIKEQEQPDDYAAMRQTLTRRLRHIAEAKENDPLATAPDLILLDGGKGHVSVIEELLRSLGYAIPVFGMVKDDHHKTRTLTTAEEEVNIARRADVFRFLYGIQEEVHRYTVAQMTNAKRKTLTTSALEEIKGIGPKKAKLLIAHFSSLKALKSASVQELGAVEGISQGDAEAIYAHFRSAKQSKEPRKEKTT